MTNDPTEINEDKETQPGVETPEGTSAPEAENPDAGAKEEAAAPEDPLSAAQAEVTRWKDVALRSQADLENFRKRMAREKMDAIQFANADLLRGLLPIIDNFEMGLKAAEQHSEGSAIHQGMTMVHKQLRDFLSDQGVETVPGEGETFDPNVHEAIQQMASSDIPEGKILKEVRQGYKLRERLLRAAQVIVSTGPEKESAEKE